MHFAKTKYRCEVSPSSPLKSFPKIKVTRNFVLKLKLDFLKEL